MAYEVSVFRSIFQEALTNCYTFVELLHIVLLMSGAIFSIVNAFTEKFPSFQ